MMEPIIGKLYKTLSIISCETPGMMIHKIFDVPRDTIIMITSVLKLEHDRYEYTILLKTGKQYNRSTSSEYFSTWVEELK